MQCFGDFFKAILAISTFLAIPYRKRTEIPDEEFANNETNTNKPALILYFLTNAFFWGKAYYGLTTFMPIHFAENTSTIFFPKNFSKYESRAFSQQWYLLPELGGN
ncbi:MAG: hypothetical protein CM1200mP16_12640 [Nitrospina sp.]|nr:MAG: hypothetical protein CM1200mP16_12640 [Nitrospina sp.]